MADTVEKPKWRMPTNEELASTIKKLTYLDDIFFKKCLKGNTELMRLMFSIILDEPDLVIARAETSDTMPNLINRDVTLDALCTDQKGRKLNLEVQRRKEGADVGRALYHAGMICSATMGKGTTWRDIPKVGVVFVVVADMSDEFGIDSPIWHIDMKVRESGKTLDTWLHIVYVNAGAKYRNPSTPLGRLMCDFAERDPDKMFYQEMAEKAKFFKADLKGGNNMNDHLYELLKEDFPYVFDAGKVEGRQEGRVEGRVETQREMVASMLADGMPIEKATQYSGLSLTQVEKIKAEYEHRRQ